MVMWNVVTLIWRHYDAVYSPIVLSPNAYVSYMSKLIMGLGARFSNID